MSNSKVHTGKVIGSRYACIIEDKIGRYLDDMHLEEVYKGNPLITPAIKREQLKQELITSTRCGKLHEAILFAFTIIQESFQSEVEEKTKDALRELVELIASDDNILDADMKKSLKDQLKIGKSMMEAVMRLAQKRFHEKNYDQSVALFVLLATLSPGTFDYWFRLGISAQKARDYSLALRAYEAALKLNLQFKEVKLLMIECLLHAKEQKKALKLLDEMKLIYSDKDFEAHWRPLWQKLKVP